MQRCGVWSLSRCVERSISWRTCERSSAAFLMFCRCLLTILLTSSDGSTSHHFFLCLLRGPQTPRDRRLREPGLSELLRGTGLELGEYITAPRAATVPPLLLVDDDVMTLTSELDVDDAGLTNARGLLSLRD